MKTLTINADESVTLDDGAGTSWTVDRRQLAAHMRDASFLEGIEPAQRAAVAAIVAKVDAERPKAGKG